MTFYAGAGISKQHRKVPSLSARLGLSISRALFLMADPLSAKIRNCRVMGNAYRPVMGKAHFMKTVFTLTVLGKWPQYSLQ